MGTMAPNRDLLTDRARSLSEEIARLEAEIASLNQRRKKGVVFRRSEYPGGIPAVETQPPAPAVPGPFRPRDERRILGTPPAPASPSPKADPDPHLNNLGVRKYDLPSALERLANHLKGPGSTNPRMVHLLAAGSIHGLRPLRYERRVARNRFLAFLILLLAVLWGLVYLYLRQSRP